MQDKTIERTSQIVSSFAKSAVVEEFAMRVIEGLLTRDENPVSHSCVYFAGYDKESKKVFIGHHKKSGLWLFNGGHIDKGETPEEAVEREIDEEWGVKVSEESIGVPKLLTIAPINNPNKACRTHFDIWYFISLSENEFNPNQTLLETEFYETGWKTFDEARELMSESANLLAIDTIEKLIN
jgi:8-oxo-dGTP pyrophosphatase MutT (NUDIX family)